MEKTNFIQTNAFKDESLLQFCDKQIVISPIYFSNINTIKTLPSIVILIDEGFYLHYSIHDWLNVEYITYPEYPNSSDTESYILDGGRCELDILNKNAFLQIEKEGFYTCQTLDDLPQTVQTLYFNFYKREFNKEPSHNLINDMTNWITTLKERYQEELNIIFKKKKTVAHYYNLNTILEQKKSSLTVNKI